MPDCPEDLQLIYICCMCVHACVRVCVCVCGQSQLKVKLAQVAQAFQVFRLLRIFQVFSGQLEIFASAL